MVALDCWPWHCLGFDRGDYGFTHRSHAGKLYYHRIRLGCWSLHPGLVRYPALVASTGSSPFIALFAGAAGLFAGGLDLVFFDELMKTIPTQYAPTFVALAQSSQHFADMFTPLLGTALADRIGLGGALLASAAVRMTGSLLFARSEPGAAQSETNDQ